MKEQNPPTLRPPDEAAPEAPPPGRIAQQALDMLIQRPPLKDEMNDEIPY